MKKKKNTNNERNTTVASYLISAVVHILLFIILAILASSSFGGSQKGGKSYTNIPIDMIIVEADAAPASPPPEEKKEEQKQKPKPKPKPKPKVEPAPESVKQEEPKVDPEDVVTEKVEPVKQEEPEEIIEPVIDETPAPEDIKEDEVVETPEQEITASATEQGKKESTGEGAETARDAKGKGKTDHEGTGISVGPLPEGAFGLSQVPICSKSDANNLDLRFTYQVEYKCSMAQPVILFSKANTSYKVNTIQQTKRIIKDSFQPEAISCEQEKTYKATITCECGISPKCEMIKQ